MSNYRVIVAKIYEVPFIGAKSKKDAEDEALELVAKKSKDFYKETKVKLKRIRD